MKSRLAIEEIIRNQNNSRYDDYRYNGRLNVAECLESCGIKSRDGFYHIERYTFSAADYSQLDFFDISFKDSSFQTSLHGAVFDGCKFSSLPRNLDGTHFINMFIPDSGNSPSFVGARFTNCTSSGFRGGDFTQALIESDGKSLGQFFKMPKASFGFQECNFDGAVIKQQYLNTRLVVSSMRNATIEDSVLYNTGIFGPIYGSRFYNVSVFIPDEKAVEFHDRQTIIDLARFQNNTISNCHLEYSTFLLPQDSVEFQGNSFVDTSFACAGFVGPVGYAGRERIQHIFESQSHGALMRSNKYDDDHYFGYPCVKYSSIVPFWNIALPVIAVVVSLVLLAGVSLGSIKLTRALKRRQEIIDQQLLLSAFRNLVNEKQYLSRNLTNILNFQSGMIKYLRNYFVQYNIEHGTYPSADTVGLLLNGYEVLNLHNPNLRYHAEILSQRIRLIRQMDIPETEREYLAASAPDLQLIPSDQEPSLPSRMHRWGMRRISDVRSRLFFSSQEGHSEPDEAENLFDSRNNTSDKLVPLLPMTL
ncbi:MAG: pentapeptide repeat-containing protein [Gammaproteobacteria bacterium]|nr:pentapeptide repeat-containing protein [Gammaproteobacteria bacterium]